MSAPAPAQIADDADSLEVRGKWFAVDFECQRRNRWHNLICCPSGLWSSTSWAVHSVTVMSCRLSKLVRIHDRMVTNFEVSTTLHRIWLGGFPWRFSALPTLCAFLTAAVEQSPLMRRHIKQNGSVFWAIKYARFPVHRNWKLSAYCVSIRRRRVFLVGCVRLTSNVVRCSISQALCT